MSETKSRGGEYAARRLDHETAVSERRRSQGRKTKADFARRRRNAGVALIAGLLLAVLVVWYLDGRDEIVRGVSIGEVEVGGMTRAEAREAVESRASATFEEIRFGDSASRLPGERLGVQIDAASATEEAFALGREGWFGQRLFDRLRAYLGGVQVHPEVRYEEQAARDAVKSLADEVYEKPQNATFHLTDDGQVEVQEAREGRVLDQEATLANLDRALTDLRSEVPLAEGEAPKPRVTTEEVRKLKPTEVIGEYKTDFRWDSNPNRKANMKLAASAVNGTLVAPGKVFSFNELASDLDYHEAKTFSEGGVGYADGGGLCQVSSTLYMAAQYAGLEIVERHPHYAVLPYIKPGFDATVWFGDEYGYGVQDMKFRNTTDGYILVREWVDERGFLRSEIQGQPTGKKVEMRTEKIFESTVRGIKWATYKKVTKDGEVLFNGLIHDYIYSYNPPVDESMPHYDTSAPRVSGWNDPGNTTGWAEVPQ
ncbi:MAG: putative vancomycin resistance protein-like protein [Rubrobacteraceae bacterium]|nr:putative vancomycin resistance protein-like protein [Rubrobacteraceae bacterium]